MANNDNSGYARRASFNVGRPEIPRWASYQGHNRGNPSEDEADKAILGFGEQEEPNNTTYVERHPDELGFWGNNPGLDNVRQGIRDIPGGLWNMGKGAVNKMGGMLEWAFPKGDSGWGQSIKEYETEQLTEQLKNPMHPHNKGYNKQNPVVSASGASTFKDEQGKAHYLDQAGEEISMPESSYGVPKPKGGGFAGEVGYDDKLGMYTSNLGYYVPSKSRQGKGRWSPKSVAEKYLASREEE